ncbi:MAG: AraC family transcriptional regulator [Eubacteriales bacterium]|nr:AraC family transcriptional regulator [Eubacteriales bacterium]
MTVKELVSLPHFTLANPTADIEKIISDGICCDLLSWVMAKGDADMAWVTVQTHMNVVAVAVLHDFSCIILSENNQMSQDVLAKASDEGIAVIHSDLPSYQICGILYGSGVKK